MAKGNLVSKILEKGKKAVLPLAAAAAMTLGGYISNARADLTHTINPTTHPTTQDIQDEIDSSEPNDVIVFEKGTYQQEIGESYTFLGNRDYVGQGAILSGDNMPSGSIIKILDGGHPSLDGGNLSMTGDFTLQNSYTGIWIGDGSTDYDNINIRGVTFYVSGNGVHMDDIKNPSNVGYPAVTLRDCISNGGEKLVFFNGATPTEESPYASVINSTLIGVGIASNSGSIDIPSYQDPLDPDNWILLGNDAMLNLILINSYSMTPPANYQYFHSPNDVAQLDVTYPLITGVDYGGGAFTGDNCFETDDLKLVPGTIIPRRYPISPLVKDPNALEPIDRYIGREEPLRIEDLNLDKVVNFKDFAIFARDIYDGSNVGELVYMNEDWLKEDPNYPN